jgi:tetratricopeptide (TPR) repeat protein
MGIEQQKQKTLLSAEQLLRAGKLQEALVVLERMAASASSDPLTLNRMGDLLARFDRKDEAISYYFRIAVEFTQAGFYPKAVAIHKKILRLNPDNIDSLVNLGELYLQRRLPADARSYLLRASELYLQAKNFTAAREVFEKLAAAEPDDPRHRVRLAETIAAEGDGERAGDELLTLAESLLKSGKCPDAERTYRRAAELLPDRVEPMLGICDCLAAQGQENEALEILEKASEGDGAQPAVLGARALIYEKSGRKDKTVELLKEAGACDIPASMMQNLFRYHLDAGEIDDFWNRVGPALQSWAEQDKLTELYRQLAAIEENGHIPAMERWRDTAVTAGDGAGTAGALEALVQAYQAREMDGEAKEALQELEKLAPDSPMFSPDAPAQEVEEQAAPASAAIPEADVTEQESDGDELRLDVEAPAVPLNRGDEEFVAGRLTQAEILEKYGLHDQALQQVREVIEKFPGHVPGQEKLVLVLRTMQDRNALREALIGLALARKAVGDSEEASKAAAEARRLGSFDEATSELLEKMGLLQSETAEPVVEQPAPPEAAAPPSGSEEEQVVLIDFDDVEEEQEVEEPAAIQAPVVAPVAAQVSATPGGSGVAVEQPAASAPAMTPTIEPMEVAAQPAAAVESGPVTDSALDDLSAITAALESEVFTEETEPQTAEAEAEQSLEEVFATFKQHVAEEVGSEDFRTHYDLGIAYKEMGFLDEAISEFEQSSGASDLAREVPTMLAMCYRQKGDTEKASDCYRQAIELAGEEAEPLCELRYELADMYAESGDAQKAAELFKAILEDDPAFRDAADRAAALESSS